MNLPLRAALSLVAFAAVSTISCGGENPTKPASDCAANPSPVVRISATYLSSGSVRVSWALPDDPVVSNVRVLRKEGTSLTDPVDPQAVVIYDGDLSAVQVTDDSTEVGLTYTYAAWTSDRCGDLSTSASALVWVIAPPTVTVTPQIHSMGLQWTPVAGASEYVVRASTTGYPTDTSAGRLVYHGPNTSVDEPNNLTPDITQYYSVFGLASEGRVTSPGKGKGVPLWETDSFTWVFSNSSGWWPTSHANGDCDFAGYGPRVTFSGSIYFSGIRAGVTTSFYAVEWSGGQIHPDGTDLSGSKNWGLSNYERQSELSTGGWQFDKALGSTTFSYTYESVGHEPNAIGVHGALKSASILGDTDGNDVCNTTADDTHVVSFTVSTTVQFKR